MTGEATGGRGHGPGDGRAPGTGGGADATTSAPPGIHAALVQLYEAVGAPPLERLVEAAGRAGRTISKGTAHNILHGTTRPRPDTAETFVVACLGHARTRRPRIDLPADQSDLALWRDLFRGSARATRPSEPTVGTDRDITTAVAGHFASLMEREGLPAYLPAGLTPGVIHQDRTVSPLHPEPDKKSYRLSWEKAAGHHTRIVLLADAGMGKSWLPGMYARKLARRTRGEAGRDTAAALPLALRCDELVARPEPTLSLAVAGHVAGSGVVPNSAAVRDRIARWMSEGRAVLLLDAQDELADTAARARFRSLLLTAPAQLRIVVSARQAGYTGPPAAGSGEWRELVLDPFGTAEIEAVIRTWPLRPEARTVLSERVASPQLSGLAQVPLLLALLCALAAESAAHDGVPALPTSRGALYERMLRRFLVHEHRPPAAEDTDADRLLSLLAPVAFHFATMPEGWQDVMRRDAVLEALDASGASSGSRQDAATLLRMLSVNAGVLQPMGDPSAGRDTPYLFAHRSFGEYLTARHLSGIPEEQALSVVDVGLSLPGRWQDTLAMLGRLTLLRRGQDRFERLLTHLLERQERAVDGSVLFAVRMLGDFGDTDLLLPDGLMDDLVRLFRLVAGADPQTAARTVAGCPRLPDAVVDALAEVLAGNLRDHTLLVVDLAHHAQQSVTTLLVKAATGDVFDGKTFLAGDFDQGRAVAALTHRPGDDALRALLFAFGCVSWPVYTPEEGIPHEAAVDALCRRRDPGALAAMLAEAAEGPLEIGDIDWQRYRLRRGALQVLAGYPDDVATQALLAGAEDPNPNIRETAIQGLVGRDTPAVRRAVDAALREEGDNSKYVRAAARKAATALRMTGHHGGTSAAPEPRA
ncbi:HEAT repeat domain-containing protein [Streptomyces sp. NPDC007083]|uniref:NACHT domain-containing protein n=1 Tax=Streptomyces sp. NPDC007083 TaxID=3156913 RepID=UPI0034080EA5